jgi:hypothetical protein
MLAYRRWHAGSRFAMDVVVLSARSSRLKEMDSAMTGGKSLTIGSLPIETFVMSGRMLCHAPKKWLV